MKKYSKIKWLLFLFLLGFFPYLYTQSSAQEVPQAIKYQAVIHDIEGNVLANRSNISIRVTLRKNTTSGDISYREDHNNLSTDMFGVVHLVIGRGVPGSGFKSLEDVSWGDTPIYAQVEVELDNSGYTQMGASELLSVPYALYAGNSGGTSIGNLSNNVLPKYDDTQKMLVNSGIFQNKDSVAIKSKKIVFDGTSSYTFPAVRGVKDQVLQLKDENGTLGWAAMSGGGGTGGKDARLDQLGTDNYMVFWDNVTSSLRTSKMHYGYNNGDTITAETPFVWASGAIGKGITRIKDTVVLSGRVSILGDPNNGNEVDIKSGIVNIEAGKLKIDASSLEINGKVEGNNNILLKDLSENRFLMGDLNNKAKEVYFKGDMKLSQNKDTLYFPTSSNYSLSLSNDTVYLDSNGVKRTALGMFYLLTDYKGVWKFDKGRSAIYNNGDTNLISVGVGTAYPQSKMHVSGGSFMVSDKLTSNTAWPVINNSNGLIFGGEKAAFRVGGVTGTAWDNANVGKYSIGMGLNTKATKEGNIAIGEGAEALAPNSIAIGTESKNDGESSFVIGMSNRNTGKNATTLGSFLANTSNKGVAIGYGVTVNGVSSIGIGIGTSPNGSSFQSTGDKSLAIGFDVLNEGATSVAIGNNVKVDAPDGNDAMENTVAIGSNLGQQGQQGIMMGYDLLNESRNTILIGTGTGSKPGTIYNSAHAISIGAWNEITQSQTGLLLGSGLHASNSLAAVNIGTSNSITDGNGGALTMGYNLKLTGRGVVLGAYNNIAYKSAPGEFPALVVGVGDDITRKNAMEVSSGGNIFIDGKIYTEGVILPSDVNLKKDIRPLNAQESVLQLLKPMKYVYKKDAENKLHFGFIAQEVELYFPNLVYTDKNGIKGLNYIEFIPILWQYTQGLEKHLQEQTEKLQKLESEIEQIKIMLENGKSE